MINEWKKVGNAIMIFDTFDWGVCSVSLPLCNSWLCQQSVIFICDGNAHTDHDNLHRNLSLLYHEKAKQELEPLDELSLSHKTGERSIKVLCILMRTVA